ncbi:MAG: GH116 family glycosyl-hydrolase, partial [Verrucomicrobiae bacterium]|nr:GH116 family glycosyl-hydrolase [Verrucomicrobiae bacterium]
MSSSGIGGDPVANGVSRRKALKLSAVTALGAALPATGRSAPVPAKATVRYNAEYKGERLGRVAFPMGGIGAGMICLEGTGALSHFSLHHRPQIYNEPCTFAAVCIKGKRNIARVLEGPVPRWKLFNRPGTGNGASGTSYGLPRFREAVFRAKFPFGIVTLRDKDVPLAVEITGWSPFEPNDPDNASLPVAGLEYRFTNKSSAAIEAVFSWNARNFMVIGNNPGEVLPTAGGFILRCEASKDKPHEEGAFSATVDDPAVKVN